MSENELSDLENKDQDKDQDLENKDQDKEDQDKDKSSAISKWAEELARHKKPEINMNKSLKTDVEDIEADDYKQIGNDKFPVFDISKAEFYNNMRADRKRLRFASGSKVQKFRQQTKNRAPFYIRYTDSKGSQYIRKIK